jgi:hypothetical protein
MHPHPLPWKIERDEIRDAAGEIVANWRAPDDGYVEDGSGIDSEAMATIVAAVNAHDSMVTALAAIVEDATGGRGKPNGGTWPVSLTNYRAAKDALAACGWGICSDCSRAKPVTDGVCPDCLEAEVNEPAST